MLKLTKMNGGPIYINENYIETIDAAPDATINLHNGTTYVVKEKPEDIIRQIKDWNAGGKKNKKG
jgi:uncharacterized protein YlzI (FlbEa/FlbD family)